jgi:hypothetical protein
MQEVRRFTGKSLNLLESRTATSCTRQLCPCYRAAVTMPHQGSRPLDDADARRHGTHFLRGQLNMSRLSGRRSQKLPAHCEACRAPVRFHLVDAIRLVADCAPARTSMRPRCGLLTHALLLKQPRRGGMSSDLHRKPFAVISVSGVGILVVSPILQCIMRSKQQLKKPPELLVCASEASDMLPQRERQSGADDATA